MYRSDYGQYSQPSSFDQCLKVSSEFQNESPTAEFPITIKFVVTNTSSTDPSQAEITFEEVRLRVGVPPNWHNEIIPNLKGGQSHSFDLKCKYADLLEIKCDIEGTVSPIAFFKTKRSATPIHPDKQTISLVAYLQMLNDTKIHKWLQETLKNMTFIGPNTTIADVNNQVENINRIVKEIEKNKKLLNDFLQFIPSSEREDQFNRFKVQLEEYLNNTIKEFAELSRFYNTKEFQRLPAVRDHSVERLARFALEENKNTEELMKQRNISDQDAHYSYRGWHI